MASSSEEICAISVVPWLPWRYFRENSCFALDAYSLEMMLVCDLLVVKCTMLEEQCTFSFYLGFQIRDFLEKSHLTINVVLVKLHIFLWWVNKYGPFPWRDLYRVILSVLDPRKCEYLKDYSLDFEHAYMTTYMTHEARYVVIYACSKSNE